jgi:hypothetical protein
MKYLLGIAYNIKSLPIRRRQSTNYKLFYETLRTFQSKKINQNWHQLGNLEQIINKYQKRQ